MENYKPNSLKYREAQKELPEEKKIQKIVSGGVKSKKKSDIQKFADLFVSEDVSNVKDYVFRDILIPNIKKIISEIINTATDMFLYGESSSNRRNSGGSKISYRNYYDKRNERDYRRSSGPINRFDYDDIILENRGEAEAVLTQMDEIIQHFGVVSVLDLYDMIDITAPYTADKYGWTDLRTAKVVPVRDGYLLKLPRALPLD